MSKLIPNIIEIIKNDITEIMDTLRFYSHIFVSVY